MKRQHHSSSPPSSPLSNSQVSDEFEPVSKRSRISISSPTPPPDNDNQIVIEEDEDEEIIVDEPIVSAVILDEDSQNVHDSDVNDDDIVEIEQQNLNYFVSQTNNPIIVVSDSDSDDDQGIDVTNDIPPSVSSIINTSISSSDIEDVEIVQEDIEEEPAIIDEENEQQQQQQQQVTNNDDDDHESLEILANDGNNGNDNELIDLTEDELISISCSSNPFERKLSIDVQQCPICLETLTHLQRTGVYLIITQCRHVMCTSCTRQLLATSSRCPLCRENVSSTTLMPYCILT
ncbi:unnamed protein product [Rotaria sordida]|uniref:RING-type domain-containing protein n=1 Tax=Rotaria sordida TaxID=392033 RepID=A0A813V4L6_9BILA|nr:unnamed protein product [Rotaria sordida]